MSAKRLRIGTVLLLLCLVLVGVTVQYQAVEQRAAATLSQLGSTGTEVKTIQQKLKNWGYYSGAVDGIYGSKTQAAVSYFQRKNGLVEDGIAGPATLRAMGIFGTSSSSSANSYSQSERNLLARAINGEARGEPIEGQVAVGSVILNRVDHPSFPNTIAGVIYQPGAFTAVSDGQINADVYDICYRAADLALSGWDPSGGAIYYYNPATATSQWIFSRPVVCTIGKHVFAK